jgi:hypothetical protein
LFDRKGVLASGKQKLLLFFADTNNNSKGSNDETATAMKNAYASLGDSFLGPGASLYNDE